MFDLPFSYTLFGGYSLMLQDVAARASQETYLVLDFYMLASAIVVGVLTTGLVFYNARRMHGGVFGTVLTYFALGMFLVLLGFLTSMLSFTAFSSAYIGVTLNVILFIVGYSVMAIAAHKLYEVIKGDDE